MGRAQVQVRLNSRGRERVLKVKVYYCAPPLYIHSCAKVAKAAKAAKVKNTEIFESREKPLDPYGSNPQGPQALGGASRDSPPLLRHGLPM